MYIYIYICIYDLHNIQNIQSMTDKNQQKLPDFNDILGKPGSK